MKAKIICLILPQIKIADANHSSQQIPNPFQRKRI